MNRRALLRTLLLAGLALAAPAASAARLSERERWRLEALRAAWKRAAIAGRPLLLIVIPADQGERWLRAGAWGELFGYGSDEVIAALSLAEVATATEDDLRRLLRDYRPQSPVPVLVRVDAAAVPATWRAWTAELPNPEVRLEILEGVTVDSRPRSAEDAAAMAELERQVLDLGEQIDERRAQLLAALPPEHTAEDESRAWYGEESRQIIGPLLREQERLREERQAIEEAPVNAVIDERIAALTAVVMEAAPDPAALAADDLAERRRAPIPGARWGESWGCGTIYDEPDPLKPGEAYNYSTMMCGMGYVPERSAMFLDFLVEEPGG